MLHKYNKACFPCRLKWQNDKKLHFHIKSKEIAPEKVMNYLLPTNFHLRGFAVLNDFYMMQVK